MEVMNQQTLDQLVRLAETGEAANIAKIFQGAQNFAVVNRQQLAASGLSQTLLYGQGGLFTMCADDTIINASLNDAGIAAAIPRWDIERSG